MALKNPWHFSILRCWWPVFAEFRYVEYTKHGSVGYRAAGHFRYPTGLGLFPWENPNIQRMRGLDDWGASMTQEPPRFLHLEAMAHFCEK